MENKLIKLRDEVHDEKSFLKFVRALIADRVDEIKREKETPSSPYSSGVNGWENLTVEDYLNSAAAWVEDSNFGRNLPGKVFLDNCWHQYATFLYAGKIYE